MAVEILLAVPLSLAAGLGLRAGVVGLEAAQERVVAAAEMVDATGLARKLLLLPVLLLLLLLKIVVLKAWATFSSFPEAGSGAGLRCCWREDRWKGRRGSSRAGGPWFSS